MESESALYNFVQKWVSPVVRTYSRLEIVGLDNLPPFGSGAILACNHSGSMWWDALCLVAALGDRKVSFVAHHWDAKLGVMRKLLESFDCGFMDEHVCDIGEDCSVVQGAKSGKLMALYPEESYHSFRHRYTLFSFSHHVIKYAKVASVPVIPITIIGVEEAAPTLFGPKFKNVPLHVPLHPPIILPFKVTIDIGKAFDYEEFLSSSEVGLQHQHDEDQGIDEDVYGLAAQQLRQNIFSTMSKYRTCQISDEKYIERTAWY